MTHKFLFSASMLFVFSLVLPAMDLGMKDATLIQNAEIISKDQFGVQILVRKGSPLRKFIPFSSMDNSTLQKFPFCDTKSVDRIAASLVSRKRVCELKFADGYKTVLEQKDCAESLKIPSDLAFCSIFACVSEVLPNGIIVWAHADAAESSFFGKLFLENLITDPDGLLVVTIYPTGRTMTHKGIKYKIFTILEPEGGAVAARLEKPDRRPRPGKRP